MAESAVPWYHYIPLKADYSDLYDILAFFVGPMNEDGSIDESKGHDVSVSVDVSPDLTLQYLGKKIGEAGQKFTFEHWRWQDLQAYVSEYPSRLSSELSFMLDVPGVTRDPPTTCP